MIIKIEQYQYIQSDLDIITIQKVPLLIIYFYFKMLGKYTIQWFMVLMIPVLLVTILHFVIPLMMIVTSLPLAQQNYSSYRIQAEQKVKESEIILAGNMITSLFNRFQITQSLFNKLLVGQSFQSVNIEAVKVLTPNEPTQNDIYQSRWFTTKNISSVSEMNQNQLNSYQLYKKIQPFARASILTSKNYAGMEIILQENGESLLFQFPTNNVSIFSIIYNQTLLKWKLDNKKERTVFNYQENIFSCLTKRKSITLVSVICLKIKTEAIKNQIHQIIDRSQKYLKNAESEYFLITPVDSVDLFPKILFSMLNNSNVIDQQYFNIPKGINQFWWNSDSGCKFREIEINSNSNFLQVPIRMKEQKIFKTFLFFVIKTQYKQSQFNDILDKNQVLRILLPPTISLIVISTVISMLILKWIISDFNSAINVLDKHCNNLLKQILYQKIPPYSQTKDLRHLFEVLGTINELHQASSQIFFTGPYPQKLLKYFTIKRLFEKLQYDTTNLLEIMGNCFFNMKDLPQAAKCYTQSIDGTLKIIKKGYGTLKSIYLKKKKITKNGDQNYKKFFDDANYKKLQKNLKVKLFKKYLCLLWSTNIKQKNPDLMQVVKIYRMASFPYTHNSQHLMLQLMEVKCCFAREQFQIGVKRLKKITKNLVQYKKNYNKDSILFQSQSWVPHEIVEDYYYHTKALQCIYQKKIPKAFKYYVKGLQSDVYSVEVEKLIRRQLKVLMQQEGIFTEKISKCRYMIEINPNQEREFIFLFDWTYDKSLDKSLQKCNSKEFLSIGSNILDRYISLKDRLSIVKFDEEAEVVCMLTLKQKNEGLLKRQLNILSRFKLSRYQADLTQSLKSTIERIKRLICNKILIVFVRRNTEINVNELDNIVRGCQKLSVIVLKQQQSQQKINQYKSSQFFILNINNTQDLERVLMKKKQMSYKNSISIF